MHVRDALRTTIETAEMITQSSLKDLTDAELLHRPAPNANHIAWQVGHLVQSEWEFLNILAPGAAPDLPAGFAQRYSKENAASDNPADFDSKETLLALHAQLLAVGLNLLASEEPEQLDVPTGVNYAPTRGAMYSMLGVHWLMHSGQWTVIRRQLGRPPLF
ncbi:DinB family protein [Planctomicrobium sp. SH664]|uniref:DinB family protein n=1 Tax=Planctomicrobium sp. SH664 TaxID=3448125 RepID=UPI003F5C3A26